MAPFGPGHTALNGIRCSTTRREPPVRRVRLVLAAATLLSRPSACGDEGPGQAVGSRRARLLWVTLVLGCMAVVVLAACSGGGSPCPANGDAATVDRDDSVGSVTDAELCPTERGEAPLGFPGFYPDGTMARSIVPEPTPELIEWSDWCFFDMAGTGRATAWACASIYSSMAAALDLLGMDPQCVLAQSRARIKALAQIKGFNGREIAEAKSSYGWHLCPSEADPDPYLGKSLFDRCMETAEFAAWADARRGGCQQWAQAEHQLVTSALQRPESHGCALALSYLARWAAIVKGEHPGYKWSC